MIDIKRIVEKREEVENGLLKRLDKGDFNLDKIVSLYELRKKYQLEFDTGRAQQNSLTKRWLLLTRKVMSLKNFF